jgi:hypothetical protein
MKTDFFRFRNVFAVVLFAGALAALGLRPPETLLRDIFMQVRVVLRALALLQLAEHTSAPEIARVIPLTPQAIRRLGHR